MKKLLIFIILSISQLTSLFAEVESSISNEVKIIKHNDTKLSINITTTSSTNSFFEHWKDIANIIIKQCDEKQKAQVNAIWLIVKKNCQYQMFDTIKPDSKMTVDIEFLDDDKFQASIKTPHEDYEFEGKTEFPKFENIETKGIFTLKLNQKIQTRAFTVIQRRDNMLVGNIYIPINAKL